MAILVSQAAAGTSYGLTSLDSKDTFFGRSVAETLTYKGTGDLEVFDASNGDKVILDVNSTDWLVEVDSNVVTLSNNGRTIKLGALIADERVTVEFKDGKSLVITAATIGQTTTYTATPYVGSTEGTAVTLTSTAASPWGDNTFTVTNSTAAADTPTLVAGADKFVTKFGVLPVAQVDTITVSGKYEAGDKITVKGVADADVVYTVLAEDVKGTDAATAEAVAAKLITAITNAAGATVTAAAFDANTEDGKLTLTAKTAGTPFTATVTAANKAAVAQVDTITVSGKYVSVRSSPLESRRSGVVASGINCRA